MQVSRGCGTLTPRSGWWGEEGAEPFVGFGSARWGWAVEAGMGAALLSPILRARLERPRGVLGKSRRFRGNGRSVTAGRGNASSAFLPSGLPTTSWGQHLPSPSGTGEHVGGMEKLDALPPGLRPRSRPGRLEVGSTGHHGEQERRQLSVANR